MAINDNFKIFFVIESLSVSEDVVELFSLFPSILPDQNYCKQYPKKIDMIQLL